MQIQIFIFGAKIQIVYYENKRYTRSLQLSLTFCVEFNGINSTFMTQNIINRPGLKQVKDLDASILRGRNQVWSIRMERYLGDRTVMSTIKLLQALHTQIIDFDLLVWGRYRETGTTGMKIQVVSVAPGFLEAMNLFSGSWIGKATGFVIGHRSKDFFFGCKSGASDPSSVSYDIWKIVKLLWFKAALGETTLIWRFWQNWFCWAN